MLSTPPVADVYKLWFVRRLSSQSQCKGSRAHLWSLLLFPGDEVKVGKVAMVVKIKVSFAYMPHVAVASYQSGTDVGATREAHTAVMDYSGLGTSCVTREPHAGTSGLVFGGPDCWKAESIGPAETYLGDRKAKQVWTCWERPWRPTLKRGADTDPPELVDCASGRVILQLQQQDVQRGLSEPPDGGSLPLVAATVGGSSARAARRRRSSRLGGGHLLSGYCGGSQCPSAHRNGVQADGSGEEDFFSGAELPPDDDLRSLMKPPAAKKRAK
eukprot:1566734-Amphidinium_carterae.2